jgi:hypothetical protein
MHTTRFRYPGLRALIDQRRALSIDQRVSDIAAHPPLGGGDQASGSHGVEDADAAAQLSTPFWCPSSVA